jgi:hypothetical protein
MTHPIGQGPQTTVSTVGANDAQTQQGQATGIQQVPPEILTAIGQFVAIGDTIEAAKNAVHFGQACKVIHAVTQDASISKVIENGRSLKFFMKIKCHM